MAVAAALGMGGVGKNEPRHTLPFFSLVAVNSLLFSLSPKASADFRRPAPRFVTRLSPPCSALSHFSCVSIALSCAASSMALSLMPYGSMLHRGGQRGARAGRGAGYVCG